MDEKTVLDFTMKDIGGAEVPLRSYAGRVLMIVNVASKCGLTPQYAGLQSLWERYGGKGFSILGFPANNFLRQEPGDAQQIQTFCTGTFGVSFPLFSKISVRGKGIHPLYGFLTGKDTNPDFAGQISWNFAKFLVDRTGKVIGRFKPQVEPLSLEVTAAVEKALADG
jgi:glutathione peroxidase